MYQIQKHFFLYLWATVIMASEREKEKYRIALTTTRDIRNLVNDAFENAIKDFSTEKAQLKETLMKLEKKLR